MSVDNPQPIKLFSFTLSGMLRYQAPLRCIFIWVFWHFQFLFPVFFFPLWLDADALGYVLVVKSRLFLFRYKARSWAQKVWSLQALLFSVLSIVSKISGFWATDIKVYCYKFCSKRHLRSSWYLWFDNQVKSCWVEYYQGVFSWTARIISKNGISGSFQIYTSLQTSALTTGKWLWECLIV